MQFAPSIILKPFVKSYSVITINQNITDEVFYPSGYIEFAIKISGASVMNINGYERNLPAAELLGHLTLPTRLNVAKGTCIIIARFFPFACPLFFPNPIADFTNYATDLYNVFSDEIYDFYDKLMSRLSVVEKVQELDDFLVRKLKENEDKHRHIMMMSEICNTIFKGGEKFDGLEFSQKYGLSERYIQKLFHENVGLSPAALFSVTRFNKALDVMLNSDSNLTSVAYDCGYYDQSHFIKEFKKFTGIKPTAVRSSLTENGPEFQMALNIGF